MKAGAETLCKRLTELGLAGARDPVQQDVQALFLSLKRAAQEAERKITPSAKMLKILPSHGCGPDARKKFAQNVAKALRRRIEGHKKSVRGKEPQAAQGWLIKLQQARDQ